MARRVARHPKSTCVRGATRTSRLKSIVYRSPSSRVSRSNMVRSSRDMRPRSARRVSAARSKAKSSPYVAAVAAQPSLPASDRL